MREIVLPGDIVIVDEVNRDILYKDRDNLYATVISLYDPATKTIVPLEQIWKPRVEEKVVGIVQELSRKGYIIWLHPLYKGVLRINKELKTGDAVYAEIKAINGGVIDLKLIRELSNYSIIKIKSTRIPRVIGKNSSMINQIKELSKSDIVVGMNGVIAVRGPNTEKVFSVLRLIEKEAHKTGLTEKVSKMLNE
ncbi:MAG: exosome complex component Rrp4 [Candidatus Micrarchaeota archaeon]|nr:MAG: exosome complex component Rrp4 [Candidatus Micrarchaeota archaeon]